MKKKILLALLIVGMLACLFAITSSAVVIDGIDYSFSGSEATVTGNNKTCTLETVSIPETVIHEGTSYTVTKIADSAFKENDNVKHLTTPKTIKSIGEHAFREMDGLITLTVNASEDFVKFTNAEAYSCDVLETVDLSGCEGLKSLGGSSWGHTFYECKKLKSVTLPEGLTTIKQEVFRHCSSLTSIEIPDTVTYIGNYAFQGCKLTSFNVPKALTYFGCNNLQNQFIERAVLPATLTGGSNHVFHGSQLKELVIAATDFTSYDYRFLEGANNLKLIFFAGNDTQLSAMQEKLRLTSWQTVTYAQYLIDSAKDDFNGYTSKTIVFGTQNCSNCYELSTNEVSFQFTDFISTMSDSIVCSCGKATTLAVYDPIVTFVGLSAKIDGDKICMSYIIDKDSLAIYEEKTGKTLGTVKFGVTAAIVADGTAQYETLKDDLTPVNNKTIVAPASSEYAGFDFVISGFTAEHYERLLVMCAYVYDGSEVYYVDTACNTYATPFTFASLMK